jgi:hypothetical protein
VENRWLEIRQATFYPGRAIVLTGRGVDKICALRAACVQPWSKRRWGLTSER